MSEDSLCSLDRAIWLSKYLIRVLKLDIGQHGPTTLSVEFESFTIPPETARKYSPTLTIKIEIAQAATGMNLAIELLGELDAFDFLSRLEYEMSLIVVPYSSAYSITSRSYLLENPFITDS